MENPYPKARKRKYNAPVNLVFEEAKFEVNPYDAEKTGDNTYTIKKLEIFEECTRETPNGSKVTFDKKWLDSAVKKFEEFKQKGFLPPIHVGHHKKNNNDISEEASGLIDNMRVEKLGGRYVIFADLTNIPSYTFNSIKESRLPYRSVEIKNPSDPYINSIALLGSNPPYFKFPITTVNLVNAENFEDSPAAMLFADTSTGGMEIITHFNFQGEYDMPEDNMTAVNTGDGMVQQAMQDLQMLVQSNVIDQNEAEEIITALETGEVTLEELAELLTQVAGSLQEQPQEQGNMEMEQQPMNTGSRPPAMLSQEDIINNAKKEAQTLNFQELVKQNKELIDRLSVLETYEYNRQYEQYFSEVATPHLQKMQEDGYSDAQINLAAKHYWSYVDKAIPQSESWDKVNVEHYFQEIRGDIGVTFQDAPPVAKEVQQTDKLEDESLKQIFSETGLDATPTRIKKAIEARKKFRDEKLGNLGFNEANYIADELLHG